MARSASPRTSVFHALEGTAAPVVILDGAYRIRYANQAMCNFLAVSSDDLVGVTADYHSFAEAGTAQEGANRICPPPVFAGGLPVRVEVARGSETGLVIEYSRLPDGQGNASAFLGIGQFVPSRGEDDQLSSPATELDSQGLHQRLQTLRRKLQQEFAVESLWGVSESARRLRRQVSAASASGLNVLVYGPHGTGREHLARTIHYATDRSDPPPLAPLDCRLLDGELLQTTIAGFLQRCAELDAPRIPVLLLLEVDQLERDAQQELRDVLMVEQLSIHTLATAANVLEAMPNFHVGLARRLSEFVVHMPSLSERREDIPLLVQGFVEQFNRDHDKRLSGCEANVYELLSAVDWSGEIQELRDAVLEACKRSSGPSLRWNDFSDRVCRSLDPEAVRPIREKPLSLDAHLEQVESHRIQEALKACKGNRARAARLLGISRSRFLRRLEHFGFGA